MHTLLKQLYSDKIISALDYQFAKFLKFNDLSCLIFALLSHSNSLGHSFIPKTDLLDITHWFNQNPTHPKYQPTYHAILKKCKINPQNQNLTEFTQDLEKVLQIILTRQPDFFPVVYDVHTESLYLLNTYHYECQIANFIQKNAIPIQMPHSQHSKIKQLLSTLFPQTDSTLDWQKFSAGVALTQKIAVISGGPGTGKTSTVAKVLAALIETSDIPLQIALCAPTGKAATRLSESITKSCAQLLSNHPEISTACLASIPKTALTIHRLLGVQPYSSKIQYHANHLLPVDVLLVDEASMIDLAMMYQLISALPQHARLILLGDKDQLASVESGSVLDQLSLYHHYSNTHINQMSELLGYDLSKDCTQSKTDYADYFSLLKKSYRFDAHSSIGQFAKYVNHGDLEACYQTINHHNHDSSLSLQLTDAPNQFSVSILINHIFDLYQPYLTALNAKEHTPEQLLTLFNQSRVLCATRQDEWGVEFLNHLISQHFQTHLLCLNSNSLDSNWFHGRPIMILKNDYHLNLSNGDVGLCLFHKRHLSVYFETSLGIQEISPMRLPQHETAWAMTVHKSQGSEFDHVMLILPASPNYVISRELLYTGITRAKHSLSIISSQQTFEHAIQTKTKRFSHIAKRIMALRTTTPPISYIDSSI